jgi:predicted nucleic acid-binding protein
LGILLEAKRQAHITELRPLVDDLERVGFRMSTPLKEHVLSMAGET